MRKLLLTAALAALLAAPGMAQNQGRDRHGGGAEAPHPAPSAAPTTARGQALERNSERDRARQDLNRGAGSMAEPRPDGMAGPRPDGNMSGPRPGIARPDREGPHPGRRDFSALHREFTAPRRYRAPSYRQPPGFYRHRWSFGEILPSFFWAQDYWLTDYYDFGLMPPPPGTLWVRYGSDALLIDRYSGEVIQVAYNVFY